jgi:hypothetical protein
VLLKITLPIFKQMCYNDLEKLTINKKESESIKKFIESLNYEQVEEYTKIKKIYKKKL